ncbi:putative F-box protein At1g49610 isoform X1 [Salvia miltiorrhiza]|uniref:putative F-box protein At1g49610 isoform X1 n=1 Tax=Salvia miltiorrhiza TaxID=226208 RepID=UPI0025ACF0CD|nr:putative F-box protein At1g49610 isoform X1 [Salvia miltiorrhiza]
MDEWEDYGTAEANSGRDRLSELPDSLILSILSLLDMRDVVRTSIFSKRWRNLWSTIPCLEFIEQTPSTISRVLSQWKCPKILKFRLSFRNFTEGLSIDVDSWLLFAIEKQVGELFLDFFNNVHVYSLPQSLYSCSSITKLTLEDCTLRIEENVQWNQLKILKLGYLNRLSGDAMNQILLGAPRLEELVLEYILYDDIGENENFNIRSTSLKMLTIRVDHDSHWPKTAVLRIWAPNLLTFSIDAIIYCTYLLDVPSLTHAILDLSYDGDIATRFELFKHVFRGIRLVEKVELLSNWFLELLVELKHQDMVMPLLDSKIVELYYKDSKDMLDLVGMMFPKLERLIVHQCNHKDIISVEDLPIAICYSLVSAKMTFPSPSLLHLKTFEATCSMCDPSIIPAIGILLENAPVLEKMVIRLKRHKSDPKTFTLVREAVLSMPRSSPTAQVIISLVLI